MKRIARALTGSALLFAVGVCAVGGIGCAEESFKCCECKFACMKVDSAAAGSDELTVCECPSEGFTYEECGIFCYKQVQAELDARATVNQPPLTMCGSSPKTDSVVAKNSCQPGTPVSE